MLSKRTLERTAGFLFLLLLISVILSFAIGIDVDTDRNEFRDSLLDIAGDQGRYATSLAFDFVGNLLIVFLAGVLYLVFRPHHRTLALLGAFSFLAAAVTFIVNDMSGFALNSLAEDFSTASVAQVNSIESSARAVALTGEFAVFAGLTFAALALLAFGILIVLTKACPRLLGALSSASGVLILFFWLAFVADPIWIVGFVGLIGVMLLQLLLGGWLLSRGTRETGAPQAQAAGP